MKQAIKKVILLNKKEGETPLEALSLFRSEHKLYATLPMTYAGRLDPMAEGLLVILVGEECKNKEKYLNLDKEYEFQVLFGFATDTYDILGKIQHSYILQNTRMSTRDISEKIKQNIKYFRGKFIQKYPIYSSRTVKGKPLFEYGRDGVGVEIPEREVNVKSLKYLNIRKISSKKLLESIGKRIKKVDGDFRQAEILKIWSQILTAQGESSCSYNIAKFKIKCTSGTYVRGIANSLGEKMSVPALAYSIKRTKIGEYRC